MVTIEDGKLLRKRFEQMNARIAAVGGTLSRNVGLLPDVKTLLRDINQFLEDSLKVRNQAARSVDKARWDVVRGPLIKARDNLTLATRKYA